MKSSRMLGMLYGLFNPNARIQVTNKESERGALSYKEWKRGYDKWKSKEPQLPKGTKRYYFTEHGDIAPIEHSCFYCIAINEKNAIQKFQNWKKTREEAA